ncbi:hypothetical protein NXS19_007007 [Fusarium pseudograminearum]|nr:hypothetical protein NXS19_007007 [Fusarium pseudograminearum]
MSNSCDISPGREFSSKNVNDNPPTAEALKAADAIELYDGEGKKHTFKSIYNRPDLPRRVLVVFVRHFFCCSCVNYTSFLAKNATPEKLKELDTAIVIVGHGDVKQVDMYRLDTGWQPLSTQTLQKSCIVHWE